jgi:uncharacterized repeat protein (TIGR01451 family)
MKELKIIMSFMTALCFASGHSQCTQITINLFDSFGDGWNGGSYILTDLINDNISGSGSLGVGSSDSHNYCLPNGCYHLEVSGGAFPDEISWNIEGLEGGTISGGAPVSMFIEIGTECSAPSCQVTLPECVNIFNAAFAQVILSDPSCCEVLWDGNCQAAYSLLSNTCNGGVCSEAIDISCDMGSFTGNTAVFANDNNTAGIPECASSIGIGLAGQMWFKYLTYSPKLVTLSTCYVNWDTRINVFTGTCGNLSCHAENDDWCGLSSYLTFAAEPGQEYLIRIGGFNMSQGPFTLNISCEDNCAWTPPCVDTQSAAYATVIANDPECCNSSWSGQCQSAYMALNNSCNLEGCTSPGACNYVPMAGIDNGSCIFEVNVFVFYEFNGMPGFQPAFDFPMPNHPVLFENSGVIIYTDITGHATFQPTGPEQQTISVLSQGDFVPLAGSQNIVIDPNCSQTIISGVINPNQNFGLNAGMNLSPIGNAVHCTLPNTQTIWLTNAGNVPLNGTITVTHPAAMLPLSNPSGGVLPVSTSNGMVVWSVNNQLPGTTVNYTVVYSGPGLSFMSQTVDFLLEIEIFYEDEQPYQNTLTFTKSVMCAYDPNDKLAEPEGYAEPHFIEANQEIEYKIRFQNTGNFTAFDVVVTDTLDINKLDISSFIPLASSHNMVTSIGPNGVVDFIFDGIMLPDSTTNEPESHGWILFKIRPLEDILPGSLIENTAYIYFDSNPPIITNTTWHTIVNCDGLSNFVLSENEICEGQTVNASSTEPFITDYHWNINGDDQAENAASLLLSGNPGSYEVTLTASHPLCEETETKTLVIHPAPTAEITQEGIQLTASAGASWQWFLNGTALEGANAQAFNAEESGLYTVLVINEFGCSDMSEGVMVVSVGEMQKLSLLLYPNPMSQSATLVLETGLWQVDIYDTNGRKVRGYENATDRLMIMKNELAAGVYSIRVAGSGGVGEMKMVIE